MTRYALEALNGHCLNVTSTGEGPAIIAIHGFTGDVSSWDSFRKAAPGYSVISIDMPGHGASDSPDNPELYDMAHTIRALEEILVRLRLQRVHWLGYSMGGRIALAASIMLPGNTASLTVESASPGLPTPEEQNARVTSDNAIADRINKAGIEDFVDYWQALPMWESQSRLPQSARARLRAQRLSNSPTGLANSLRGIGTGAQPAFHQRLAEIKAPVLLVAGEDDAKYAAIAREMHQSISGSRLAILPRSGHAAHLEQPTLFNQTVMDFLRGCPPPSMPANRTGSRSNQ